MKTSTISVCVDPELQQRAEAVFRELGLTTSQAIILFYQQVALRHRLPFELRLGSAEYAYGGARTVRVRSPRGKYAAVPTSADAFARRKQKESCTIDYFR